jgi:hypothetical protein
MSKWYNKIVLKMKIRYPFSRCMQYCVLCAEQKKFYNKKTAPIRRRFFLLEIH